MGKKNTIEGRKRPQLNIPLENLELDNENPRLAKEYQGATQIDIFKVLLQHFNLEELAFSMAENGYFEEEPIVVVPRNLPKSFKASDYKTVSQLQDALEEIILEKNIKFITVEGNRRTATAKILTTPELRTTLKVKDGFPKPKNKAIENDLKIIPAILYNDRKDISPYLGVRHITGILKWEAYAKAKYIASRIEERVSSDVSVETTIKEVQQEIGGDRTDVIKKQYMCYKIVEQAQEDISFDISKIIKRFSLIYVALNSRAIREYIEVPRYKEADLSEPLVPTKKLNNLKQLLTWIYGNEESGEQAVFTDSRKISSTLAPVLADVDATEYLIKHNNLEEAYERSGGELTFLIKRLSRAERIMSNALSIAFNYKTDEIRDMAKNCLTAASELMKMVSKDD